MAVPCRLPGHAEPHVGADRAVPGRERDVGVLRPRRRLDPQRVVQDRRRSAARDSSRPGPSPARPRITMSSTIATAPGASRIVTVRSTSAPSATISGASSRISRAPSPTVTSSSSTRPLRPGQRDRRRDRLDRQRPRLDDDLDPVVIARQRPGLLSHQRHAPGPEHPRRDALPRRSSRTASVHVIVVVIGHAFHGRVEVAVGAERGELGAHPGRRPARGRACAA